MAEWIMAVFTMVTAVFTGIIAFFTFQVWRVYEEIKWITGSMESYSNVMLQIEARRGIREGEPVKLLWWDPTTEDTPITPQHGQEIDRSTVYVYMPPKLRKEKRTSWEKLKAMFRLPEP